MSTTPPSELYLRTWQERLQSQEALNSALATRAMGILTLTATLVVVSTWVFDSLKVGGDLRWVFVALVVCLAAIGIFCIWVLRTTKWRAGPGFSECRTALAWTAAQNGEGDDRFTQWLGNAYLESVCANASVIEGKGRALRYATYGYAVTVAVLAVTFAVVYVVN